MTNHFSANNQRGAALIEYSTAIALLAIVSIVAVVGIARVTQETVCRTMSGFGYDMVFGMDDPLYRDPDSGTWYCPVSQWNEQLHDYEIVDAFTGTLLD